MGETERKLPLAPGYFGGIDLSPIDIDARDKRKELLYRRRAPGDVDPPFMFSVGIYTADNCIGRNSRRPTATMHYVRKPDTDHRVRRLLGGDDHGVSIDEDGSDASKPCRTKSRSRPQLSRCAWRRSDTTFHVFPSEHCDA